MLENLHYIFDIASVVGALSYFLINVLFSNKLSTLRYEIAKQNNLFELTLRDMRLSIELHARICDDDRERLNERLDNLS